MQVDDTIEQPIETDPDLAAFHRLPSEALTAELLSATIFWILVTAAVVVGATVSLLAGGIDSAWLYLVVLMGWLLFTAWCFGWPVLSYRCTFYRARDLGLEIKRGVLWRKHHFVPRSRIQHSDINQGPFQRRLGISKLVVYTAGSARHTTALTGVTMEEAQKMRSLLTGHQGEDSGV